MSVLSEMKKRGGRPAVFETPDELWEAALRFFEDLEANPIIVKKLMTNGPVEMTLPAPVLMQELHAALGLSRQGYSTYTQRPRFSAVCSEISNYIRGHNLKHAMVGNYQHAIVASYLGDFKNDENKPAGPEDATEEAVKEAIDKIDNSEEY